MARIRATKPEYYLDPDVQSLSLAARFLFQGMWCQADDRGRLLDHPALICAQVFAPTDRVKPDALLAELASGREPRILRYEAKGKRIIAIRAFRLHQRISKPQESRLPPPPLSDGSAPFQGYTQDEESGHSTPSRGTVPHPVAEQLSGHSTPEVEVEGEVEREGEGEVHLAPPTRRDELFEAVAEECGIDWHALTPSSRGPLNRVVKELRAIGVEPSEVQRRADAYRGRYSVPLTPSALAKHWPSLGANGRPVMGSPSFRRLMALADDLETQEAR